MAYLVVLPGDQNVLLLILSIRTMQISETLHKM